MSASLCSLTKNDIYSDHIKTAAERPTVNKMKDVVTKRLHRQSAFSHWRHQSASHGWLTLHQFVISRNMMLLQQFLPAIRQISSEFFIFQQDNATTHRALQAVNLSSITFSNVEDVQKFFHNRLSSKFLIKERSNVPSYLNQTRVVQPVATCRQSPYLR